MSYNVDESEKERFCGYCGRRYIADWKRFSMHLDRCERDAARGDDKPKHATV